MLRVIIADDEIRICKLIINLINWDELGMEITGIADNGIAALNLIEKEKPDIVITDIRMPGYDGLELIEQAKKSNENIEFIIISGYEEFAYAQKAMEYGVKDYLCKPINKDNLLKALYRVAESLKIKDRHSSLEQEYQTIKKDIGKLRVSFVKNLLLFEADSFKESSLEVVNQNYYFHFQEGCFRVISIKMDGNGGVNPKIDELVAKLADTLDAALSELTYEREIIRINSSLFVLINYRPEESEKNKAVFIQALNEFKGRFATFGFMITIGYGAEVTDIKEITASAASAKEAIDQRILKGTGHFIEFSRNKSGEVYDEDRFCEFTKKFIKAVELLDTDQINRIINTLKETLSREAVCGSEIKRLAREIGNTYYITMRNNKIKIANVLEEQTELENTIDNSYSMELLFEELGKHITGSLSKAVEDKTQKNLGQIKQAKNYIEENYMKNITLEDIGSYLGFNPSYFSTLFKKETGTSFVEYLTKIRMEKAKELLKEPGLRIQDVCLMVGYNDVKYFTKLFIKHTGIKPNEYRKVFA